MSWTNHLDHNSPTANLPHAVSPLNSETWEGRPAGKSHSRISYDFHASLVVKGRSNRVFGSNPVESNHFFFSPALPTPCVSPTTVACVLIGEQWMVNITLRTCLLEQFRRVDAVHHVTGNEIPVTREMEKYWTVWGEYSITYLLNYLLTYLLT